MESLQLDANVPDVSVLATNGPDLLASGAAT